MRLRSLLVGSAAILALSSGARAEPVEYLRVCDTYGAGFFYIPGTDTCLRISGRVRADATFVDFGDELDVPVFTDLGNYGDFNRFNMRAKGDVSFDLRTATAVGQVRAYLGLQAIIGQGDFDTSVSFDDQNFIRAGFVQLTNSFGTFVGGHTGSFFDFWGSDTYGSRLNIDDPTANVNLLGWTLARRGGISYSLAVEFPYSAASEYPTFLGGETFGRHLPGDDEVDQQHMPDLVGNIRIDQGWGSAQVMTALRHISENDGDGFGFALGVGGRVFAPGGWQISAQAGYANGAIGYVTNDWGPNYAFAGADVDRYGIGDLYGLTGEETNRAWSIRAGVEKSILPNLDAWLNASYTHVEQGGPTSPAQDGPVAGDEYNFWAVVAGVAFEPREGLSIGPEVAYNRVRGDDPDEEGDIWGAMFRASYRFGGGPL